MATSMKNVQRLLNNKILFPNLTKRHYTLFSKITSRRSYCHAQTQFFRIRGGKYQLFRCHKPVFICAVPLQRFNSNDAASNVPTDSVNYIPEPPPLPADIMENLDLNALGEPTLASLGLGNYTPSGLVQHSLEMLHVSFGLPWWEAIIIGTLFIRLCMFPLVIITQRNSIRMSNYMPTIQKLQARVTEARVRGDTLESMRLQHELMDYMKRNDVKVLKNFLTPAAQIPIFLSVFWGLKAMANLPVESMTMGGMAWFTDLTIPDPCWGLPLITMVSLSATLEECHIFMSPQQMLLMGSEGFTTATMGHTMKWVIRLMPLLIFYFVSKFPAAMCVYWATSNTISLMQAAVLRIPVLRKYFNIPERVKHSPAELKKKGFVEGFRENMDNSRLTRLIEERQRIDAINFQKAGQGPIPKTYASSPKERKNKTAISIRAK